MHQHDYKKELTYLIPERNTDENENSQTYAEDTR